MRFYKLIDPTQNYSEGDTHAYLCTRNDIHDKAKVIPGSLWPDVRIELVEIATDQKNIANILSGWGCEEKVLQTWRLTPRGGLVECPNGE